jgi:hypothetical protein
MDNKSVIKAICGKIGSGKTAYITYCLIQSMLDNDRIFDMHQLIKLENDLRKLDGRPLLSFPIHPVFSNYDIKFSGYRFPLIKSYRINPFRLGFDNSFVKTHFIPPFSVIGITEGQKYFDSHHSIDYPRWQSSFFEMARHYHLDIYIDCQREMLINANIRELAEIIDIEKFIVHKDEFGQVTGVTWKLRRFADCVVFSRFYEGGKKDKTLYTPEVVTADYNIFKCYDSHLAFSEFMAGHEQEDFDLLDECDTDLPKGFYNRKEVYIKNGERS